MFVYVSLDYVVDNPYQRRAEYGDLEDLAARIHAKRRDYPDTYGLMQVPIGRIVSDHPTVGEINEPLSRRQAEQLLRDHGGLPGDNLYRVQLAFGHRRLRAFHILAERYPDQYGRTMPVNVLQLSDDQMLDSVWSENRERRDLSAVEEAELLAEKLERARAEGGNQATVAEAWGLSRPTVANRLRLLDLPAEVQQAVRERNLSERQALALLGVAGLAQRLNGSGDVNWGDTGGQSWFPRSPAGYIAHVVANPDGVTSDAIRDYVKTASRHAGMELPDLVATTPVDGEVIRDTCKGCPHRYDQYCLYRPCLDNKLNAIAAGIAQAAAEEVGLPYSGDPRHFEWFGEWSRNKEIRELRAAGITENLVVGYDIDAGGAGLFRDRWASDGWAGDGRALVILGHRRGKPTDDERRRLLAAVIDQATDKPARPLTQDWEKRRKLVLRARQARGRAAVRAALEDGMFDSRAVRLLHAMFAQPAQVQRAGDDVSVSAALAAMWEMARAQPDKPAEWAEFLAAAGLDPNVVEARDDKTRLNELVTEAADGYYQYDSDWRHKQYAAAVIEACAALDTYSIALDEDIAVMAGWLRRALPDAERLVAEREEESKGEREEQIVRAADAAGSHEWEDVEVRDETE